jgi:hypothetical protein
MHLDAHPVVEQNASVIAQTNPGPACANDGITLLSKQEAVLKTRLEERSLGESAGEPFQRKSPPLEGRYRIPCSEVCSGELLVKRNALPVTNEGELKLA